MGLEIIQERLQEYSLQTKEEEENAIKEICQEIALAGLSRTAFFKDAAFQGGTCLRILYQLKRFSEDLDFVLMESKDRFDWEPFLLGITTEFESFGLNCEAVDRSEVQGNIKKAFLKENSFGKVLNLQFKRQQSDIKKVLIKLEIDINPPSGSFYSAHYLQYPYPFSIISQDKASLFSGKCHALLCRSFLKGRDWYDFLWYVQRKTPLNLNLLKHSLEQQGPYQGSILPISKEWIVEQLRKKIVSIDWVAAKKDVEKFIPQNEQYTISSWGSELFLQALESM
jgi:hypothetical protein